MICSRICPCKPRWHCSSIRFCHSISYNKIRFCCSWRNREVSYRESLCSLKYGVGLSSSWWDIHFTYVYCHIGNLLNCRIGSKLIIDTDSMRSNLGWICCQKCDHRNTSSCWNCRNWRLLISIIIIIVITFPSIGCCGTADWWSWTCTEFFIYLIVNKRLCYSLTCSCKVVGILGDPVCRCARNIICVLTPII